MTEITKICLFGDGVLETYLDIEGKLDSFYTLTDDLTTSVDEMNDPNGDVQKMVTETSPVIAEF